MNIHEISKIDIKDLHKIDLAKVKEGLENRPHIFINTVLIVLTTLAVMFFYNAHNYQSRHLKDQIRALQEKVSVIKEQGQYKVALKKFSEDFPKYISSDNLINLITDFASQRNIQILSFSPAEEKRAEFWSTTSVVFNISAANYVDFLFFIQEIENSPYALKIEKLTGSVRESNQKQGKSTVVQFTTEAIIKIQSIHLKDV